MHDHKNTSNVKIVGIVKHRSVNPCSIQTDATVMQAGLETDSGYYRLFFGVDSSLYPTSKNEGRTVQITGRRDEGAVFVDEMRYMEA